MTAKMLTLTKPFMHMGGPEVNTLNRQDVTCQEGSLKIATVLFAAIKGNPHFVTRVLCGQVISKRSGMTQEIIIKKKRDERFMGRGRQPF
jgi:hypothetical protein